MKAIRQIFQIYYASGNANFKIVANPITFTLILVFKVFLWYEGKP